MRTRCAGALVVFLYACGPTVHHKGGSDGGTDSGPTVDAPHTLSYISITPTNPIVELDLNAQGSQGFIAYAVYADGTQDDVSAQATWTVANPAVGTMSNAVLDIPGFATSQAVVSLISADYAGLTGQAQITVVAYRRSGPQQDFFFILPYTDPAGPQNKPLDFSTVVPALDVFFLMDTTGSMTGEIANLRNALTGTVIPGIQAAVANSQFGVGALEDFPLDGYGDAPCTYGDGTNDQPFKLRQAITSNMTQVTNGVSSLAIASGAPIGCGADGPEAGLEAIYQAATGEGLMGPSPTSVPANHTGVGGVGFRSGTMPVIVAISDVESHGVGETGTCSGTDAYDATVSAYAHSRAQTKTALNNICARLVGLAAQGASATPTCIAEAYFEDLSTSTGARVPPAAWDVGVRPAGCASNQCCTGFNGAGRAPDAQGLCPVVFRVNTNGTGVSQSIVTGIQMLTRFAQFDVTSQTSGVTTDVDGNPLPTPHTTADFLKTIVPATYTLPAAPPVVPAPQLDATTFHGVTPGTTVGFTVNAFNDFVMQTSQPQIFRANIQVLAGGCTPLDQRDVLVLVPPMPIQVQ
jgi:hypothetical protein